MSSKSRLDDAGIKTALRKLGKGRQDMAQLARVLDGLCFSMRGGSLAITFPHKLFAPFYQQQWRQKIENLIHEAFGQELAIQYSSAASPAPGPPQKQLEQKDPFEAFLGHERNAMAIAAAKEACLPEISVKLLVFCGQSGCGKTTLLKAIRAALAAAFGQECIYMGAAATFQPQLEPEMFWQQRKALLLDDCHLPCEADIAAYIDAAHTCRNARAILAFSGSPKNLRHIGKRLMTRIQSGLILELSPPDLFARIAYIERNSSGITRQQALNLARHAQDMPTLAGLLQKAQFYGRMAGRPLQPEELDKLALPGSQQTGWQRIVSIVAERTRQKTSDILGPGRKHELVLARMAAMYLCRRRLGLSYPEIGRLFGGRNHASVIYGIKKILELRKVDKVAHMLLTELESDGQF